MVWDVVYKINEMTKWFKQVRRQILPPKTVSQCSSVEGLHFVSNGVNYALIPPGAKELLVVGDLHGDYTSLERIIARFLSQDSFVIFLGDYVDRGRRQLDVLLKVIELKQKYPDRVVLLRGNHELLEINAYYGFAMSVPSEIYQSAIELFDVLDVFAIHPVGLFFVHGGIPKLDEYTMTNLFSPDLIEDYLWSDPSPYSDWRPNPRGAGWLFPKKGVNDFCRMGFKMIIRGHQVRRNIQETRAEAEFFSGRLWTVFSSGWYSRDTAYPMVTEPYVLLWRKKFAIQLSPIFD